MNEIVQGMPSQTPTVDRSHSTGVSTHWSNIAHDRGVLEVVKKRIEINVGNEG